MSDLERKLEALGESLVDFLGALTEHVVRDQTACQALLSCLNKDLKAAGDELDKLDPKSQDLIDIAVAAQAVCDMAYRRSQTT